MQNSRGRRRAAGPAAAPRAAEEFAAERPRDPQREARRRRGPFRQITDFAAASGIGQKAGIALAATGLVLTVTVPATSPVMATTRAGQSGSALFPQLRSPRFPPKRPPRSTSAAPPSSPRVTLTASSSSC